MSKHYEDVKAIQQLVWANDDLMSQDVLFALQEKIADFALKIAYEEKKVDDLVKTFPWLYERSDG